MQEKKMGPYRALAAAVLNLAISDCADIETAKRDLRIAKLRLGRARGERMKNLCIKKINKIKTRLTSANDAFRFLSGYTDEHKRVLSLWCEILNIEPDYVSHKIRNGQISVDVFKTNRGTLRRRKRPTENNQ